MRVFPLRLASSAAQWAGSARLVEFDVQACLETAALRGKLPAPANTEASLLITAHASNGVPLARTSVTVAAGAAEFSADHWTFVGMEGYAHLPETERWAVEQRVWSRRAFFSGSISQVPR